MEAVDDRHDVVRARDREAPGQASVRVLVEETVLHAVGELEGLKSMKLQRVDTIVVLAWSRGSLQA